MISTGVGSTSGRFTVVSSSEMEGYRLEMMGTEEESTIERDVRGTILLDVDDCKYERTGT
jgi:hypothetical protein